LFNESSKRPISIIEVEMRGREQPAEIVGAHYDVRFAGGQRQWFGSRGFVRPGGGFRKTPDRADLASRGLCQRRAAVSANLQDGGRVYAKRSRERGERVSGMLSLETLGYCSEVKGSQKLSLGGWLLPPRGDFIALVANRASRPLRAIVERTFPEQAGLTCRGIVLPVHFPGAWSSDHRSS
jgi:hypothetical protein